MNPYLVMSSITCIIPLTLSANYKQWDLYFSLLYILLSSVVYHSTKNYTVYWIDQSACYVVIYVLFEKCVKLKETVHFYTWSGTVGVLYFGGYFTKRLVWSPDYIEATGCHVLMHLIVMTSASAVSYLTNARIQDSSALVR